MAGAKHWVDKKKEIEKYAVALISTEFKHLKEAKFLYTFRHPPAFDSGDEKYVAGTCRSIGNKEKDVYGYDFEMCIASDVWKRLSKRQKTRLVYHELCHAEIEFDEDNKPMRDDLGRLVTYVEPHEISIRTFKREIKKYGIDAQDVRDVKFLKKWMLRKVDRTFEDEEDLML
jgi:hypothetical protein